MSLHIVSTDTLTKMIHDRFIEEVSAGKGLIKKISLFEISLPSIVAFLAFALILIVFKIEFYYSTLPTALVVVFLLIRKSRENPLRSLEWTNPNLRERLRTAYDNRNKDNFIVRDLMRDMSKELLNMNTDRLLNFQRTTVYISITVALVFILLVLTFTGFEGISPLLGGPSSSAGGGGGGSSTDSSGGGGGGSDDSSSQETSPESGAGGGEATNIYSDRSIARIEGEELELELHPEYGGENEIGGEETRGQEEVNEIRNTFVQSTAAESYTENIPTRLEEIVRNYFQRLTEE